MAGPVGADLETLDRLKLALQNMSGDATDIKTTGKTEVYAAEWTGADANKFRAAWDGFEPKLAELSRILEEASGDVAKARENIALATGEA